MTRDIDALMCRDISLSEKSWIAVGGVAEWYAEPTTYADLQAVLRYCCSRNIPVHVCGAGSNVYFHTHVSGCVLSLRGLREPTASCDGSVLRCSAGLPTTGVMAACQEYGVGGFEFLAAIPGTIGGAVVMNAGCVDVVSGIYREVGEYVHSIEYVNFEDPDTVKTAQRENLDFTYRHSSISECVVLAVSVRVFAQDPVRTKELAQKNFRAKQLSVPWAKKSLGSVFKNPELCAESAGQLIDHAGLKGYRIGGLEVSAAHANVIENVSCGTTADMKSLIAYIRQVVLQKTQIALETEIECIGETEKP